MQPIRTQQNPSGTRLLEPPQRSERLRFEVWEDIKVFTDLKNDWACLCKELSDNITVFSSHAWYESWWEYYGKGEKIYIFTMWVDNKLVGIAPLMWKKLTIHGMPCKTIGFIQNNQSLHNEFRVMTL